MTLRVATDFSGLGSPEVALKRLGVEHRVVFACDKDKYAKASYLANHEPEIFYDDITLRDQSDAPDSDLYCFGFPCQAFSLAGNRKGFEDTRGTLFFNALEYISIHRPKVFIAENVKGLLSHDKPKGSKSKYGKTFNTIIRSLALTINGQYNLIKYDDCVNYHIYFQVLNSKDYGIPQNRERVFIVGFRDEANFKFPKAFKLNRQFKSLLEDEVDEKYFISEKLTEWILKHRDKRDSQNDFPIDRDKRDILPCLNARYYKTGAEDIYIADPVKVIDNTKQGYAYAYDTINISNPKSKTRRGRVGHQMANTVETACNQAVLIPLFDTQGNSQGCRVYDVEGVACTQSSAGGGLGAKTGLYFVGYRIRKLMPIETFRVMGFTDDFFYNCQNLPTSDSQLYKQGGNSIVSDTFMHLLIEVLKAINIPFSYPKSA